MKKTKALVLFPLLFVTFAFSQDQPVDRVSLTFSDPSRPGFIKVSLTNGSITVKGYEGDEIIVEARTRTRRYSRRSKRNSEGLKRVAITSTGLSVEEERNYMTISASSHQRTVDIDIKVPKKTSLKLSTVNSGHIEVEGIEGEIELNNVNGSIKAINISGSVVANTTNGKVEVFFDKITSDKPMSFVSFNGRVDVTFPPDIKANVKMKSEQGEVYSDFDIKLEDKPRLIREDRRKRGGKIKVKIESSIYGTINGGGPEFYFSTYNGSIYIRKNSN
ncbi:hypothetical protein IH922_09220 [candidate division KSB1 bacterium]|nr:hypothetical protein [candidate division KSB1 bacterium]